MNADGWWRPAGAGMPWQSTTVDTAPLSMPKVQVKPEPGRPSDGETVAMLFGFHLPKMLQDVLCSVCPAGFV